MAPFELFSNPRVPACNIIEYVASQASSTVYIYDLAEQVGFGILTKAWAKSGAGSASAVSVQTRAGAALSLVGRLSGGSSQDNARDAVLTAFTSLAGLSMMAPALSQLPDATPTSRLVTQVPNLAPTGDTFALSSSLASLATVIPILRKDIVILLSATPQESVDFAQLAYKLTSSHVIHIFDHHSSSREMGHSISQLTLQGTKASPASVLRSAGYSFFRYEGNPEAQTVLLVANGPLALVAIALAKQQNSQFGVLIVSVLRPWDETTLLATLPASVKSIHVLDDVPNMLTQGFLYVDVFGTVMTSNLSVSVHSHRVTPQLTHKFFTEEDSFSNHLSKSLGLDSIKLPLNAKKLLLFSTPASPLSSVAHVVEDVFVSNKGVAARLLIDHDMMSKPEGVTASRIILTSKSESQPTIPVPVALPLDGKSNGDADFIGIFDHTLLRSHSLLKYAKPGTPILVVTPWPEAELISNIPDETLELIQKRDLRLFTIDAQSITAKFAGSDNALSDAIQTLVVHLAFLRIYLGPAAKEALVLKIALGAWQENIQGVEILKINALTWSIFEELDLQSAELKGSGAQTALKEFSFTAVSVERDDGEASWGVSHSGSWHEAAKHLLFPDVFSPVSDLSPELFPQNPALRPELPDRTFLVTCTVNRRLTPLEYDRNVFHLEFDTSGTGLNYNIGEALGIHGWNDDQEVLDFCSWYGIDPNYLITIPVLGDGQMHTRTVFQALQQQIDLFGRPPKSFYSDLAVHATSSVDRHALLFIGSPEGSATFKKLSEKDTVTFADILRMYPSAKPGIETLCQLVGDIKPRHYSIASAQSVVGDRVDLLVVTLDWLTPSGLTRYGQCTRYLAGLGVGQKVTVSIKPSVMKLPPDSKQPLIMAGLGTGAAPFRAFLQHRAWIKQQGHEVGPVYYYFGSRHQSQEYLYGEEIEAFIFDGVITRAGLAFSRDGPSKIYIQHKMLEDSQVLAKMLWDDKGVFYLCGPTWPVPDVYEALVNALVKYKGEDAESAGAYLESLKEEERYVLEVY
ncbi:hypothetical protein C8J56DRAFT_556010 [Mycena floridula]|nr:hypothetical protein C8J56DRAFT_556010 [Mycena floridula]